MADTAASYRKEVAVGRAIQRSGLPRAELFITTKLWVQDASYEGARQGFETSMHKLGLDCLDSTCRTSPTATCTVPGGHWKPCTEKAASGPSVGVSNFPPDRFMDFLVHHDVKPAVNQVETHPFHQQVAEQQLMADYGVQIEAWGPFAEGKNDMFTNELRQGLAAKHRKTVAQVILRWLTQRGVVAIPKSVRPERMAENFAIFDFELSPEEMAAIKTLDTKASVFFDHRDPNMVKWIGEMKIHA